MKQKQALQILKLGHNVFLTGRAGSGKTYLLNQFIEYLKENEVETGITASTGIAATHMNGVTIHSWSGLGIRDRLTARDLDLMEQKPYLWKRMERVKVLIIDEVSMLHHFRLDLINQILKSFKRNSLPFGGIQVVLCGDFFQLPPVSRMGEQDAHFVYKSDSWREMNVKVCYLDEQHRQFDDVSIKILNDIRQNNVSEETIAHLHSRLNKKLKGDLKPTRLYTHNADVDQINQVELERVDGEGRLFEMEARGSEHLVEVLKKSCLAPEKLNLKIGAQVMFVKNNYEQGFVNGTLGKVIRFDDAGPVVRTLSGKIITASPMEWVIEEEGKRKAEITQVPLRLAWAITVHKSQGMTLDAAEIDLSKSFERGMGYVALSRVRSIDGLSLLGLNEMALAVNEDVLNFDQTLLEKSEKLSEDIESVHQQDLQKNIEKYLEKISPKALRGKKKTKKISTFEVTKDFIKLQMPVHFIAKERGLTNGTILNHIEELWKFDKTLDISYLKPEPARFKKIQDVCIELKSKEKELKLVPIYNKLNRKGERFGYEEIRLAKLFI
ncbi:MAG: AAA family ATPase [Patescibacteria group bacterium]